MGNENWNQRIQPKQKWPISKGPSHNPFKLFLEIPNMNTQKRRTEEYDHNPKFKEAEKCIENDYRFLLWQNVHNIIFSLLSI